MAVKRKASAQDSTHIHPDRAKQLGIKPSKPKKSRTESTPSTKASLRRSIRDIKRLLSTSETLPEDVRIEKERALAAYEGTIQEARIAKQRQHMIKKYHMVRFFERQKATRRLKKLRKWVKAGLDEEGNPIDEEKVRSEIEEVEIDLDYAIYCPLQEKYVSLYPRHQNKPQHSTKIEKPDMWCLVKRCRAEGTLGDLRDGRLRTEVLQKQSERNPRAQESRATSTAGLKIRKNTEAAVEQDDSESGFFSE